VFKRFRIFSDEEPVSRERWDNVTHSLSWPWQIGIDTMLALLDYKKRGEWETVLFGQKLVVIVA
jgi:hypothetical protein